MNFRNTLLAAGVALTTCGAAALSLGESRGTVVLGRPLDLVFQVLTDGTESVDAACVAAEVLLGDTLISQARIDITPLPAVPADPRRCACAHPGWSTSPSSPCSCRLVAAAKSPAPIPFWPICRTPWPPRQRPLPLPPSSPTRHPPAVMAVAPRRCHPWAAVALRAHPLRAQSRQRPARPGPRRARYHANVLPQYPALPQAPRPQ